MNRMRKNKLFPRQVSDIGAFLFVVLMMPATYIYETSVVVPKIYSSGTNIYLTCIRPRKIITPSFLEDNSLWLFLSFQLLMDITFTTPSAYFYLSTWLVIFWVFGWQTRALALLYYHPLSRYLRTSFNNLGCSSKVKLQLKQSIILTWI